MPKKFTKVYKAPGYPVDPKLEEERAWQKAWDQRWPELDAAIIEKMTKDSIAMQIDWSKVKPGMLKII